VYPVNEGDKAMTTHTTGCATRTLHAESFDRAIVGWEHATPWRSSGVESEERCAKEWRAPSKEADREVRGPSHGAADWLSLAAAPTFALMALLTLAGGAPDMLCSASPLTGMVPMYLLMSAFHAAPWLKLILRRQITAKEKTHDQAHDRNT
jgi:hypothetical protein